MKMNATQPEILALIPARGESKSIPRKNLLSINGKPMIAHSILQAQSSRWITRTIVSTDNSEIAQVARQWGAEVPFIRPSEFARDESTDFEVFYHALSWLRDREHYQPELVVQLRPPGPARRVSVIDAAIEKILNTPTADSLRAVSVSLQTPYKMWRQGPDGFLEPVVRLANIKESYNLPRQVLPEVFWQNGYVDIVRPHIVLEKREMCGNRILPWIIDEPILEIDYPEDIARVEKELVRIQSSEEKLAQPRRHSV